MSNKYDVIIIGAGAVGCAVARELARYALKIAVLEKECDVAAGTSGRNSAVVHAGFNNKPGSLMAQLCVEGNQGFEALSRELGVPYQKTGKYLIAFDQEDIEILEGLIRQGEANGVRGLRMVDAETLHANVPNVGGIAAMYSPETAITNPFHYTIALAENAAENGVEFFLRTQVQAIERQADGYCITAGEKKFYSRYVVNSAGLFSGKVAEMVGITDYHIYPCRGEYFILDKAASELMPVPVYPAPKKGIGGLGVHLTPTTKGNLLIGPSAEYIDDPEDYASTAPIMDKLFTEAKQLLPALERRQIIGAYSGIRSKLAPPNEGGYHDFVICEKPQGMIQLIGIESPGLTASVPIARRVVGMLKEHETLKERTDFQPVHKAKVKFSQLPKEEQEALIRQDPEYGEIVCRCEQVTKREVRDAIENPLGVRSLSGIKYRCSVTMGRCQGGYCLSRIADMLIHEYHMKPEEVTLRGEGSPLFEGFLREDVQ